LGDVHLGPTLLVVLSGDRGDLQQLLRTGQPSSLGESIGVGRSPHPATTPPVSEQHPHDWWSAFQIAMRQAVATVEVAKEPAEVAAVSVDAQAHGLVPVDASGAVIRPAKLWNDTTSVPEARELVARLGAAEWARRAGSVPPGAFTISKVLWLARHEPKAFARLQRFAARRLALRGEPPLPLI
jgi:xylulokinase